MNYWVENFLFKCFASLPAFNTPLRLNYLTFNEMVGHVPSVCNARRIEPGFSENVEINQISPLSFRPAAHVLAQLLCSRFFMHAPRGLDRL